MDKEITIIQPEAIEKKNKEMIEKLGNNEENSGNFRKLIAEIMVEIIIKRSSNGRYRIHQDK